PAAHCALPPFPTRRSSDLNVVSLPRTLFPVDVRLEPGLCLYARASGGQSYPITVRDVKADMVTVDLNHPLAGERMVEIDRHHVGDRKSTRLNSSHVAISYA